MPASPEADDPPLQGHLLATKIDGFIGLKVYNIYIYIYIDVYIHICYV